MKMLNVTNAQLAVRGSVSWELSFTGIRAQTVLLLFTLQLLQAAQQFLFIHVVSTLFPLIPQLLQRCPNFLPRGHPHLPEIVATDRERGHSPFLHFFQKLFLSLVLQELKDLGVGVSFPRLGEKKGKKRGFSMKKQNQLQVCSAVCCSHYCLLGNILSKLGLWKQGSLLPHRC